MKNKLKIVNIDGPDGAGKSSVVDALLIYFQECGKRSGHLHFPRYDTDLGCLIRDALYNRTRMDPKAMQMLYSADRLNFTKFDVPVLEDILDVLVVDRYITSGIVFGKAHGVLPEDILVQEREVRKPNLNIILLAKPETVMKRMVSAGKNLDKHETLEVQKSAYETYSTIHTLFPNTVYINAEQPLNNVIQDVKAAIETLLVWE